MNPSRWVKPPHLNLLKERVGFLEAENEGGDAPAKQSRHGVGGWGGEKAQKGKFRQLCPSMFGAGKAGP